MNKTTYRGINYSPTSNIDIKTQIRYGVICQHDVGQAWYEDSEPVYPEHTYCLDCGTIIQWDCTLCPNCDLDNPADYQDIDPISWVFQNDGYQISQDSESPDLFITESPFFTYAQFCSPCAPGACYLTNPLETPHPDNKCYCLGHDWFDNGKAPYPVYCVKTGKEVLPECNTP